MEKIRSFILAALFLATGTSLFAQTKKLNVIYIGDSITFGGGLSDPANDAPPVTASAYLHKQKGYEINFSNQGHSGYTTVDFLPGGSTFDQAEKAASAYNDKAGQLVFSIMLGTNDSAVKGTNGAPVNPESYYANLKIIIDRLLTDFPKAKIIINHPLWYSPNTYNGAQYLQEGLNRLQSYSPKIKELVKSYNKTNKNHVFEGDNVGFNYFKGNYLTNYQAENGHQGTFYLHPNKAGAVSLGEFWGKAIDGVVKKLQ